MGIRIRKNIPVATFYGLDLHWPELFLLAFAILMPAPVFFTDWSLGLKLMAFLCLHAWVWPVILKMQDLPEGDMIRRINWLISKRRPSRYTSVVPPARTLRESFLSALDGFGRAGVPVHWPEGEDHEICNIPDLKS